MVKAVIIPESQGSNTEPEAKNHRGSNRKSFPVNVQAGVASLGLCSLGQ